jgi:hypothetical protein
MPETTFAHRVNKDAASEQPWRNGFTGDNAGDVSPFCLTLQSSDGRAMEGPSMSLFLWHAWLDRGGPVEKLVLFFNSGTIYVEGLHMKAKVESIFQQGKLKRIQQHDSLEIQAIKAHNLDIREADKKEPIVLRFIIIPDLETRLKSDESLAPILAAVKGEDGETRGDPGFARRSTR